MKGITAKQFRLEELATLRIGSAFRDRIVHAPGGSFLVVQGKDIGSNGTLDLNGMVKVTDAPGKAEPDVLRAGEVVLPNSRLNLSRGYRTGVRRFDDRNGVTLHLGAGHDAYRPRIPRHVFEPARHPGDASPAGDGFDNPQSSPICRRALRSTAPQHVRSAPAHRAWSVGAKAVGCRGASQPSAAARASRARA